MPKSYHSVLGSDASDNEDDTFPHEPYTPTSPVSIRPLYTSRGTLGGGSGGFEIGPESGGAATSRTNRSRRASRTQLHYSDERQSLLGNDDGTRSYKSVPQSGYNTPRMPLGRQNSHHHGVSSVRFPRLTHSASTATFSQRLVNALTQRTGKYLDI